MIRAAHGVPATCSMRPLVRWKRRLAYTLAIICGVLLGELWVERIEARKRNVRLSSRRTVLFTSAPENEVAAGSAARPALGSLPRSPDHAIRREDVPRAPEWPPPGAPGELRSGLSWNWWTYGAEYQAPSPWRLAYEGKDQALAAKLREERQTDAEANTRTLLGSVEEALQQSRRLGPAPWEAHRFQLVASLNRPRDVSLVGADFIVRASPEASLDWHLAMLAVNGASEATRGQLLDLLRAFQQERRAAVVGVFRRVLEVGDHESLGEKIVAYAVVDQRLFLVKRDEAPEVVDFFATAGDIDSTYRSVLREILEGRR